MTSPTFVNRACQSLNLGISLAAATFLATPGQARGGDPVAAVKQSSTSPETSIPPEIIKTAEARGIASNFIQLKGNSWVACIQKPGEAESCIVLGKAQASSPGIERRVSSIQQLRSEDVLVIRQYGEEAREVRVGGMPGAKSSLDPEIGRLVAQKDGTHEFVPAAGLEARISRKNGGNGEVLDTLPLYRREMPGVVRTRDLKVVRDYISAHPEEPMIVVVTVPSHCEPCRRFDRELKSFVEKNKSEKSLPKVFLLEYFDFQTAKNEVVGDKGLFPTIITFAGKSSPEKANSAVIGSHTKMDDLTQPVEKNLSPAGRPRLLIQGFYAPINLQSMLSGMKLRGERK